MSCLEAACQCFPRMPSCTWLFSDDYWLNGFWVFFFFFSVQCRRWKHRLSLDTYVTLLYFMTSCHPLVFWFLVRLSGYSSRVWVSILSLILQLRARPRSGEAQTASIVSICRAWWWSHRQLRASLRSAALARLHHLRSFLLITSSYSCYSSLGKVVSPGTVTEVKCQTMAMKWGSFFSLIFYFSWGNWKHIRTRKKTGYESTRWFGVWH